MPALAIFYRAKAYLLLFQNQLAQANCNGLKPKNLILLDMETNFSKRIRFLRSIPQRTRCGTPVEMTT
jgi:hypothetical protein